MRSKINYQLETDRILAQLPAERTPTLFLHACCAPCSSYVLEYLSRYFAITLFFYNPNISPEAEYLHRKAELCRLVQELPLGNPVTVVDGDYLPERFYALAKGLEQSRNGEHAVRSVSGTVWKKHFGRRQHWKCYRILSAPR